MNSLRHKWAVFGPTRPEWAEPSPTHLFLGRVGPTWANLVADELTGRSGSLSSVAENAAAAKAEAEWEGGGGLSRHGGPSATQV